MRFLLINSFLLVLISQASVLKMFEINTTVFSVDPKFSYNLTAKYALMDNNNLKKRYFFFNRKRVIERYWYNKEGVFRYGNFSLKFYKSYRVNGRLYFKYATFILKDSKIKAKECYISLKRFRTLKCKNVKFFKNGKLYRTKVKDIFSIALK